MENLNSIVTELTEGLDAAPFAFDDRVLAALARQPAIEWCAKNTPLLKPELKHAVACIYRDAEYRGGPAASKKARAAYLRIFPDDGKAFDSAKPVAFKVEHLVQRGLPSSFEDGPVYFDAVRSALRELFPDTCRATLGTAVNLLRAVPDLLDGDLRLNEMTGEVMVGDRELSDADLSTFRANAERRFASSKGQPLAIGKDPAWDALLTVARDDTFHPVREFLDGLRWDGQGRLDQVATALLNSEFDLPLVRKFVRLWFIGCVARIYKPGCKMDNMLVLVGDQAHLKSTFFAKVAGSEYFTDTAIDFENKDSLMVMRRAWIAEYAEMKAILAARSEEEVKAGITRTIDEFRPPYGRATVRVPRHTVFAGTTNNRELLRDATGNRRYWPLVVARRIDIEKVLAWREQLWAEAVVAYRNHEHWWLEPDEEVALRDYQEEFTRVDAWEQLIAVYLNARVAKGQPVILSTLLSEALGITKEHQDPKAESRAKAILKRLGWEATRPRLEDGTRPVHYAKKPTASNLRPAPVANELASGGQAPCSEAAA